MEQQAKTGTPGGRRMMVRKINSSNFFDKSWCVFLLVILMQGHELMCQMLWSEMHKWAAACETKTDSSKCCHRNILNRSALAFDLTITNRIHHLNIAFPIRPI